MGHDREAATYLPTYLPTYHASPFSDKSLRAATKDRFVRANIRYDPTEPDKDISEADIWRLPLLQHLPRPSLAEIVSFSITLTAESFLKATEIANGFANVLELRHVHSLCIQPTAQGRLETTVSNDHLNEEG